METQKTRKYLTPSQWKPEVETKTIEVLPLARRLNRTYFRSSRRTTNPYGYCTYTHEFAECPEVEVMCGGVNGKTTKAAAVWRQGNLLHFGFAESPADLNDAGCALLVNSIAYISGFTEDRPIVQTPAGVTSRSRNRIRWVLNETGPSLSLQEHLGFYVSAETSEELAGLNRQEIVAWYDAVKPFIHADEKGKLRVDEEAKTFGTSPASPEFFPTAIHALRNGDARAATAGLLLARYAPDGPGQAADADAWQRWWAENQPYLFFSDTGSFRWYIDPLAKKRGVPSAELRGPSRATLPQ